MELVLSQRSGIANLMVGLAQYLEREAERRGGAALAVITLTIGFLLCLLSSLLGLGHLSDPSIPGKEIGFVHAPNWTVVYLVLFPLYLALFCLLIDSGKSLLKEFTEERLITGPGGSQVNSEDVIATWDSALQAFSPTLCFLFVGVILSSTGQWIVGCLLPYRTGRLGTEVVDWSTVAYIAPTGANKEITLAFSALAYLYMALALFVFLAILAYGARFSWFLKLLSDPLTVFRLVLRESKAYHRFSTIMLYIYVSTFLGLCAAYAMRLQATFLASTDVSVVHFMFSDSQYLIGLFNRMLYGGDPIVFGTEFTDRSTFSDGTSLGVAAYSLVMLSLSVSLLWTAFENSRRYYLDHIGDPDWRQKMRLSYNADLMFTIENQSFLHTVIPGHIHLMVALAATLLALMFVQLGTIWIGSVIYAFISVVVIKNAPPRQGPAVSPPEVQSSMDEHDREELINILSAEAELEGTSYFTNAIDQANIPKEYKRYMKMSASKSEDPAREIVVIGLKEGINPLNKHFTVLGSILIPLIEGMGLDVACSIVKKMDQYKLIFDNALLNALDQASCKRMTLVPVP